MGWLSRGVSSTRWAPDRQRRTGHELAALFPHPLCSVLSNHDCFSPFSTTAHWSAGEKQKTFPEMSMSSATVCWNASLCSRGNYSFHLRRNTKNMGRPLCCRAAALSSCTSSWTFVTVDIWFEEIRPPLCNYFISLTNNQMKGGLRFEKLGCWDFEIHPILHILFQLCLG